MGFMFRDLIFRWLNSLKSKSRTVEFYLLISNIIYFLPVEKLKALKMSFHFFGQPVSCMKGQIIFPSSSGAVACPDPRTGSTQAGEWDIKTDYRTVAASPPPRGSVTSSLTRERFSTTEAAIYRLQT